MQAIKLVTLVVAVIFLLLLPDRVSAQVESGECTEFTLQDIPVRNLVPSSQMPMANELLTLTQAYNTSLAGKRNVDEPYCRVGNTYPRADSAACNGRTKFYRHDGIDLDSGYGAGVTPIFAIQDGLVIVSSLLSGWGETVVIATRSNQFSEEIITHHYHHLHTGTRKVSKCAPVQRGNEVGREGQTGGDWPVHLHLTMRRWHNIAALHAAIVSIKVLVGSGYGNGTDSYVSHINKNHLDPEGILFNFFRDYQWGEGQEPDYAWSLPYVKEMREQGIEFGLWTGEYGANEVVKRGEAARWMKIAAERESVRPTNSIFTDVPLSHDESPYVEAMVRHPLPPLAMAINPLADCGKGIGSFCPDANLNRAEALKMVVMAFYWTKFLPFQKNIETMAPLAAATLLTIFQDVDPLIWYAPYIYIGLQEGLISPGVHFRPSDSVTRAEMAKWVIMGYDYLHSVEYSACANMTCPVGQYCELSADYLSGSCQPIGLCIPDETRTCEVGGGYVPEEEPPQPEPGSEPGISCPENAGLERDCDGVCKDVWNDPENCGICGNSCSSNSYCYYGVCTPEESSEEPEPEPTTECQPNDMEPCGNCGVKTCSPQGAWYSCTNEGECAPGHIYLEACGNGGTSTVMCTDSCRYNPGSCIGESSCMPGAQETRQCGAVESNAQSRTCDQNGQWSDWGVCAPAGVCNAGDIVRESCVGNSPTGEVVTGTRTRTCQSNGQWGIWGWCEEDPSCSPDQTETMPCNSGNGIQTRVCGGNGTWNPWGNCVVSQQCSQGQTQQRSCTVNGQVGLETRQCGSNGQWSLTWGPCEVTPTNECVCSSGPCCDGCHFQPAGDTCENGWAYRCEGSAPGQNAQQAQTRTFCSGSSSSCNGESVQYGWITMEDCGSTQVCSTSGGLPHCVANQTCSDTFISSSSSSCSGGNPNLCLEVSKVSGSQFQYRICKNGGSFDNSFTYRLRDTNQGVNFNQYSGSAGSTCSSWKSFDVQYISGYGSIAGAGLVVEVTSPSSCTQSSCRHNSGSITIRKECL